MDPNFDTNSSCPLPQWNHLFTKFDSHDFLDLATRSYYRACFANCSRAVTNNRVYKPAACLSAYSSHVYVWVNESDVCSVEDLESYCGYLAKIPFGEGYSSHRLKLEDASYADITQLITKGFTVLFPLHPGHSPSVSEKLRENINICLNNSISYFKEQKSGANIVKWTHAFFWSEVHFLECVTQTSNDHYYTTKFVLAVATVVSAIATPKFFFVLCRFFLAHLAIWIFLAYKYWRTRITIDAVEKFLRMQQMIGPRRYAYSDILAITRHLRDKFGQGGYGSVYKGVVLPGGAHVAVKMLEGNSCNGEDFISEVSTIGSDLIELVPVCGVFYCSVCREAPG